jgi:tetratricopeptide repeat protein
MRSRLAVSALTLAACAGLGIGPAHAVELSEADRATAIFESGDMLKARAALEEACAHDPTDLDLLLLLGITRYRLGRVEDAEPLIERASEADDPETAASAELFLGLIAKERGEEEGARAHLEEVASSHVAELAESGADLARALAPARASGFFLLSSEYDSDVALLPISQAASTFGGDADAAAYMLGSGSVRPIATFGLTLSDSASYRHYLHRTDFDLFSNVAAARWEHLGTKDRIGLRYAFEAMTLGRSLLLFGHVAEAGWRRALLGRFGGALRYQLRRRDYHVDAYAPYSGTTHTGYLEASYGTPDRPFELDVAYVLARELTGDPAFTATAQGARLFGRGSLGPSFVILSATLLMRQFDALDGGAPRRDQNLAGDLTLGLGVASNLALIAGATVLRNVSNVPDYDYAKWTVSLGVEVFAP